VTTVVVTYPGFDGSDERTAGALRAAGLSIRVEPRTGERLPEEVVGFMRDADAGIVSTDPFDEGVLRRCPRLRVLARVGIGVDAIDVDAATRAGVAVTITPGLNTECVADHAVTLILACLRRLVENDAAVRRGEWSRGGPLIGRDVARSTVGLIGLGRIGQASARRLAAFGVRLLGHDPAGVDVPGVEECTLDEVLARSDAVSLHVPLSAATAGLIGERELRLMPRGSFLVNTSRGGLVQEAALVAALRDGHLAGAGVDVFEREPPRGSPLLELPQVTLSPHVAGIGVHTQQAMLEMAVRSVLDVLAGREPDGLLNPGALAAGGRR
jgi:phosphoglycerate dehydrogenase-like enzyme